jgi:RNA polymerase subunit RPABC4/transcription elongation factor Spt4
VFANNLDFTPKLYKETQKMKCPHCDQEIPGSPCPQCDAIVPEEANYCMKCGSSPSGENENVTDDNGGDEEYNGFDLEERVLCPDGTCTGIIVDGKCTECVSGFKDKKNEEKITEQQDVKE